MGEHFFQANYKYRRLNCITHWVRLSICNRGYFRTINALAMKDLGKAQVLMIKLKYICFYFMFSNSLRIFYISAYTYVGQKGPRKE